jgi:hypothetical protein
VASRIETVQELPVVWTGFKKEEVRVTVEWMCPLLRPSRESEDNFRRQSGATFVECLEAAGNASIAARIAVIASPAQRQNRLSP